MFEDADARYRRDRSARVIRYGSAIATIVLVLVWITPGYWAHFVGRPIRVVIAAQGGIAFGVALAAIAVLERVIPARRHPFLDGLPPPDRA